MPPTVEQKLTKYLSLTQEALDKVQIIKEKEAEAQDILDLAQRYYKDAHYFESKEDKVNALIAVCYAHAFLDIGARTGLFDVDGDDRLFMVDGKE